MGAYSPVDKAISRIPHFTAAVSIYGSVVMVGIHDPASTSPYSCVIGYCM